MYALAFGVRDTLFALFFIGFNAVGFRAEHPLHGWIFLLAPLATLAVVVLASYGTLRTQLFDIDLKIQWTLGRGTVAAAIMAAFLIVSQLVENLASDKLGLLAGSIGAGVLLFFIHPLVRMSEKLAQAAMPRVRDTPEYRLVRKQTVYRAAAEQAFADGHVTAKERDILATLADQLGLSNLEARRIEREAAAALHPLVRHDAPAASRGTA